MTQFLFVFGDEDIFVKLFLDACGLCREFELIRILCVCVCVCARPRPSLMENYELLKSRLATLRKSRQELDENLRQQAAYNRTLEREMNALKPELHDLCKTRDLLQM